MDIDSTVDRIAQWEAETVERHAAARDQRSERFRPRPVFKTSAVGAAYRRMEEAILGSYRTAGWDDPPWNAAQWTFLVSTAALCAIDAAWEEPTGFVYMMAPEDSCEQEAFGHVKIGFSGDPDSRLRQIQTGCPTRLRIARMVPATVRVEQALHEFAREHRSSGEWFRMSAEISIAFDCLYRVAMEHALIKRREMYE